MKKIVLLFFFFIIAFVTSAQVEDTFADDDFTANPAWTSEPATNWIVVNSRLRSNVSTANTSFSIITPSATAVEAQWEFYVNLAFNTSGVNYADVYLISEQADLLSATNNGYFVRIGGTPDEISLYKLTNGVASLLINGTDGVTNKSNNTLRIKVTRESNHTWTLAYDALGGTNYMTDGTATDDAFITSSFFGIRVQQSSSGFFNKHFFDDIYAGEIRRDTQPPVLQSITVVSASELTLLFDEKLEKNSAENTTNYLINNNLNNPSRAVLQSDEKSVLLTYGSPFLNGRYHELTVSQVADIQGNKISSQTKSFLFFQPQPVHAKDIILTELFADVTPQVGLPEAEFVELYNRSANPVDLMGWKFSDGSSVAILPSQIILPGEYKIICAAGNASLFNLPDQVIGVANFPALNNTGEAIKVMTAANVMIDSVNYALSWYRDEDKQEGGWTLELIDPQNPCGEEDNWTASEDERGGTPGRQNSVYANKPDLTAPRLLAAEVTAPGELLLRFDEKLENNINPSSFTFNPGLKVSFSSFTSTSLREVKIGLEEPLEPKTRYTIRVEGLRDCSGNAIQAPDNEASFALPEEAAKGDILLNELLFNPRLAGVDFIEVVNVSEKYINLKNWALTNIEENVPVNLVMISADRILAPREYLVFTSNKNALKENYPNSIEATLLQTLTPPMADDEGSIALIKQDGEVMDAFKYTDNLHSPLLKDREGVSLERISFSEITQEASNWKSASSAAGFATPGYLNSSVRPDFFVDENAVTVEPEIFSPASPGRDFARINYRFDQGGLVANVKIVDHQGRIIKEVANNETLALKRSFRWDGDRDDAGTARRGYYFVWFEVFTLDGTVNTHRKRIVVAQ